MVPHNIIDPLIVAMPPYAGYGPRAPAVITDQSPLHQTVVGRPLTAGGVQGCASRISLPEITRDAGESDICRRALRLQGTQGTPGE